MVSRSVVFFLKFHGRRGDGKIAGREEVPGNPSALGRIAVSGALAVIRRITKAGSPLFGAAGVKSATISASASHNSTSVPSSSEMRARIKQAAKVVCSQGRGERARLARSLFSGICPAKLGRVTQLRRIRILP